MLEIRGGCLYVSEDVSETEIRVEYSPCFWEDLGWIGSGEPGRWEGKECMHASPQQAGQTALHVCLLHGCCQ
jgi:hypothetical protein